MISAPTVNEVRPNAEPAVSVVLGSYNRIRMLKKALKTIRAELRQVDFRSEIIVVDGGSTDGSVTYLVGQKDVILILQHNRGFWKERPITRKTWGYFMNLGFKIAKGKYICMTSDDCLIIPGAILNAYSLFEKFSAGGNAKIGAMAFYWRNWPVDIDYVVGVTLGGNIFVNHGMYLSSALEAIGYADEETYQFYCADGDICLKMKQQGFDCIDAPNSYVEHFFHANTKIRTENNTSAQADQNVYTKKWGQIFAIEHGKGDWIKRYHVDQNRTAREFLTAMTFSELRLVLSYFLRRAAERIKRNVRSRQRL